MLDGKGPALALNAVTAAGVPDSVRGKGLGRWLGKLTRSSHASPRHHWDRYDDTYVYGS